MTADELRQQKKAAYARVWRARKLAEDPDYDRNQAAKRREATRRWREKNRDKLREQNRAYRAKRVEWWKEVARKNDSKRRTDPEKMDKRREWWRKRYASDLVRTLFQGAKARAKRFGLSFSITKEDIIVPDKCPILGIPLIVGSGKQEYGSPSLDRIDNRFGYVSGNVRVISWRANWLKRDASFEELIALGADAKRSRQLSLSMCHPAG